MKKTVIVVLLSLAVTQAFTMDFGLDLLNVSTGTYGSVFALAQTDRAELWFSHTEMTWGVKISGFYEFSGTFSQHGVEALVPYRFDIGNTQFKTIFPALFGEGTVGTLCVGRFALEDTSSRIVSGLSDGVEFGMKTGAYEISVMAGFTGLLFKDDANVIVSATDFTESFDNTDYFAPRRLFFGAKGKVLELMERLDLAFDLHAQFDLRGEDIVNTQYAELSVEGRPLRWFKWSAYAIGETWFDSSGFSTSMAAGTKVQFSFPETVGLVLIESNDWASGTLGPFRAYAPVKQVPIAVIYRASFTDILCASLSAVIRPLRGIVTGVSAYAILRASDQVPADTTFPETSGSAYLGTEALLTADFKLTSDLSINLWAGAFVPNTVDAYESSSPVRWLGALELKYAL